MSARQPPETAPLGVNVYVWATDGTREKVWPDCKRFFAIGAPRFIGLPDGWRPVAWVASLDSTPSNPTAPSRC